MSRRLPPLQRSEVYRKVHSNPSWCVYETLEKHIPTNMRMDRLDFEVGADLDNVAQAIRWDLEDRGRLL